MITRPISAEAITGFKRTATVENFVICTDLEMIVQVRVQTLNADGIAFTKAIADDENISGQREQFLLEKYQDQVYNKETRGAWCTPMGQIVPAGTPGAIARLQFFQGTTLAHLKRAGVTITDKTSLAELIYIMLGQQIDQLDAQGEF